MFPNSLSSLLTYTKNPVQSRPTPETSIAAGIMVIILFTTDDAARNKDPGMTRAQPELIQKGVPLDISPAENG